MTQDEIIRMAREAGLPMAWISDSGVLNWTDLKAFADLIAAHKAEVITAEAYRCGHEVAAELRRLHESNQELLEALKALSDADETDYISIIIWEQARAAINKAEGEMK